MAHGPGRVGTLPETCDGTQPVLLKKKESFQVKVTKWYLIWMRIPRETALGILHSLGRNQDRMIYAPQTSSGLASLSLGSPSSFSIATWMLDFSSVLGVDTKEKKNHLSASTYNSPSLTFGNINIQSQRPYHQHLLSWDSWGVWIMLRKLQWIAH